MFADSNRLVFAKLKDTINNEENNITGALADLQKRVETMTEEEKILEQGEKEVSRGDGDTLNSK